MLIDMLAESGGKFDATIRLMRANGDVSPRVPDGFLRAALGSANLAMEQVRKGEPIDDVMSEFMGGIRNVEELFPGELVWDDVRAFAAGTLLGKGHRYEAAHVVRHMTSMRRAVRSIFNLEHQMTGRPLATRGAIDDHLQLVLLELEDEPQKYLSFMRHLRNHIVIHVPESMDDEQFDRLDAQLVRFVGDGFDSAHDWAETERELLPGASWDDYEAIVRDDSLWGSETSRSHRMQLVHAIARDEMDLAEQRQVTGKDFEALRSRFTEMDDVLPGSGVADQARRIYAGTLFKLGHSQRGYSLARDITHPAVTGGVAAGLLGRGMHREAIHVLTDITDTDVVAMIIEEGEWPDRKLAEGFSNDIITLNKYEPEWRAQYMESLAAYREKAGDDDRARSLRSAAALLRMQVERGIVKYKPPKKK